MNLAILIVGAGRVGATLGKRWLELGHDVRFGVPDPESPKYGALAKERLQPADERRGAATVFATPYAALAPAARALGDLSGAILIDGANSPSQFPEDLKEPEMSLRDPNPVNARAPKRVAIVLSNPAISTTTGWPVGFWWSELAHPYFDFVENGYEVEVFSPKGGKCEADAYSDPRDPSGYSETDLISMGFLSTPKLAALVDATKPVSELALDRFDAIVVAGGQGPMFTFEHAHELHEKFVEFYEAGKLAAALCHGVAILRYAKLSNGDYLAKGKTVTGFANVEEDFADNAVWTMGALTRDKHVMPWRIEDELKKLDANYIQAGLWRGFAIRDGNLITGQQNFSGAQTAKVIVDALGQ